MQMAFQLLSLSFHFSFPKKENNTCMRKSTIPRIKRTPCSFPGSALLWPAQHVRLVTLSGYIFCSSKKDMLWGHSTPTFSKLKKKMGRGGGLVYSVSYRNLLQDSTAPNGSSSTHRNFIRFYISIVFLVRHVTKSGSHSFPLTPTLLFLLFDPPHLQLCQGHSFRTRCPTPAPCRCEQVGRCCCSHHGTKGTSAAAIWALSSCSHAGSLSILFSFPKK